MIVSLLRLRHERGVALRNRMLEAADDFVAAYTEAHEATLRAHIRAAGLDAIADEDASDQLPRSGSSITAAAAAYV